MPDLEQNKETVRALYDLAFNQKRPEEAVARHVGSNCAQHNPMAGDGPAAVRRVRRGIYGPVPRAARRHQTRRRGGLVVTRSLIRTSPEDRGTAAADTFRLRDGKVVEYWDALQPVPETAVNDNTML